MFQIITSVLIGLFFTFLWTQFKEPNQIRPSGTLYIHTGDVVMLFILNAVFTVTSWNILNLLPLVII